MFIKNFLIYLCLGVMFSSVAGSYLAADEWRQYSNTLKRTNFVKKSGDIKRSEIEDRGMHIKWVRGPDLRKRMPITTAKDVIYYAGRQHFFSFPADGTALPSVLRADRKEPLPDDGMLSEDERFRIWEREIFDPSDFVFDRETGAAGGDSLELTEELNQFFFNQLGKAAYQAKYPVPIKIDDVHNPVRYKNLVIVQGFATRIFFHLLRDSSGDVISLGPCPANDPDGFADVPVGGFSDPAFRGENCPLRNAQEMIDGTVVKGLGGTYGTFLIAVDKDSGELVWASHVDDIIMNYPGSLTVHKNIGYVTTTSAENFHNWTTNAFVGLSASDISSLESNFNNDTYPFARIFDESEISEVNDIGDIRFAYKYVFDTFGDPVYRPLVQVHECCTSRGSVIAVNLKNGKILWQTFLTPGDNGDPSELADYTGTAASWGGATFDKKRKLLYVTTGQNFTTHAADKLCELQRRGELASSGFSATDLSDALADHNAKYDSGNPGTTTCDSLISNAYQVGSSLNKGYLDLVSNAKGYPVRSFGNYPSSVVALDAKTGEVKWAFSPWGYENYDHNCVVWPPGSALDPNLVFPGTFVGPNIGCPNPVGWDNDFGIFPMLYRSKAKHMRHQDVLAAINKNAEVYLLNPDTGVVLEDQNGNPLQKGIGISATDNSTKFAAATDGRTIYLAHGLTVNARNDTIPALQPNGLTEEHELCTSYELEINYTIKPAAVAENNCVVSPSNAGVTHTSGSFVTALDASTLEMKWQWALPSGINPTGPIANTGAGITLVDDVLFIGNNLPAPDGKFFILDRENGEMIQSIDGGGIVGFPYMHPSASQGVLYWLGGSNVGTGGKLFALELCPEDTMADADGLECVGVPDDDDDDGEDDDDD